MELRAGAGDIAVIARRRAKSPTGPGNLIASLTPGVVFAIGLVVASFGTRFAWLRGSPLRYPWELWVIAIAGGAASLAGILDWRLHRRLGVAIGAPERRAERIALVLGGLPLFAMMAAATVLRAQWLLVPVVAQTVLVVVLVCYDELVFHRRRCSPEETRLHRILTLGQATALLAWMHFCFVRAS